MKNLLDYVGYLKGVGTSLRSRPEQAASLARDITHLEGVLRELIQKTEAEVAAHWTQDEIAEARRRAADWEK